MLTQSRTAPPKRIISLWLPHFTAEWRLREIGEIGGGPFAIVSEVSGATRISSLNQTAEAQGLARGMSLSDARAMAPDLITRSGMPEREAAALAAIARWAGRFSPFIATEEGEALVMDASGCAHLFGGETAMLTSMVEELANLGFTARAGMADTRGAAWALARYAPTTVAPGALTGDGIAPDAHATRVRTPKRKRWTRPEMTTAKGGGAVAIAIAPPGRARAALNPLPLAALRLPPEIISRLQRLGLRRVEELTLTPRAGLARRFGMEVPLRLDQALGMAPEPISPGQAKAPLAARISFPEPIGLTSDIEAALDRLLAQVCKRMEERAQGARKLRLMLRRVDGEAEVLDVGLARPTRDPQRIAPLFARRVDEIDAGYGIDAARLLVITVEPLSDVQHSGHFAARAEAMARLSPGGGEAFADLLSRIGGRIGLDRLTRPLLADSHIPEKAWLTTPAAYSEPPTTGWPDRGRLRPAVLHPPERIVEEIPGRPPERLRWRGRSHEVAFSAGPERIAPEWWLDDPNWRSGPRDYWRVETAEGLRLWLFEAHGGDISGGWFAQGEMV
ncbi:MAG: DNA polymerase Y family protein [Paracoccaceae bacterium]|nr:DNA polymerase Y family protein [Paracoccaceae bacterium]MDG1368663.1 DNA polymerase Y family protein [Paracoccaceae bacterium]MDG1971914.1 DNA polymerase Y family protein [Paracoccaceae bacterium]